MRLSLGVSQVAGPLGVRDPRDNGVWEVLIREYTGAILRNSQLVTLNGSGVTLQRFPTRAEAYPDSFLSLTGGSFSFFYISFSLSLYSMIIARFRTETNWWGGGLSEESHTACDANQNGGLNLHLDIPRIGS